MVLSFIIYVGMQKQQKQNWERCYLYILPIPAFQCTKAHTSAVTHSGGLQEWLIQISSIGQLALNDLCY